MLNKNQIHIFSDLPYSHQHGSNYKLSNSNECIIQINGCSLEWVNYTKKIDAYF
jgi:hypothetical protein